MDSIQAIEHSYPKISLYLTKRVKSGEKQDLLPTKKSNPSKCSSNSFKKSSKTLLQQLKALKSLLKRYSITKSWKLSKSSKKISFNSKKYKKSLN